MWPSVQQLLPHRGADSINGLNGVPVKPRRMEASVKAIMQVYYQSQRAHSGSPHSFLVVFKSQASVKLGCVLLCHPLALGKCSPRAKHQGLKDTPSARAKLMQICNDEFTITPITTSSCLRVSLALAILWTNAGYFVSGLSMAA